MKTKSNPLLSLTALVLNILWVIFWILLWVLIIPHLRNAITPQDEVMEISLPVQFEVNLPPPDPNLTIETDSEVELSNISNALGAMNVQTQNVRLQHIAFVGGLLDAVGVLFIIFQLRKIIEKIRKGAPFMKENLNRIKTIAFAVLIYQMAKGFYAFVSSQIVATEFYIDLYIPDVEVKPTWEFFNLSLIGFVLVILVIEYTFREGLELQEDKDLTI